MTVKLRKPILIGGIGISFLLWLWDSLSKEMMAVGEWTVLAAIALGTGLWMLKQNGTQAKIASISSLPLKREIVEQAIAQTEAMVAHLKTEAPDRNISAIEARVAQLPKAFERQHLQVAITGANKVGKTSLKHLLEARSLAENLTFVETAGLLSETNEEDGEPKQQALASDLILFLVNGDLTDSEWQIVREMRGLYQRLILVLNKEDRYPEDERVYILQQLRRRVQTLIASQEVMSTAAAPNPIKVKQHQEDGSVKEWMEAANPSIEGLCDRLSEIFSQPREQLVLGTIWREAKKLQEQAKEILNEVRRDRALPAIEQYQWIAAGTAFANPVPALDLLATVAINAQMLVDLSAIYQQKFSLSQAQTATGTIGQLMVKLGLVELSTQTIASLLKSNAITYVAGGAIQGVSAAYLTRLAGLSLIEYFQEQDVAQASGESLNLDKLGQKLKQVFEQNQRSAFLQNFVKQAIGHLAVS